MRTVSMRTHIVVLLAMELAMMCSVCHGNDYCIEADEATWLANDFIDFFLDESKCIVTISPTADCSDARAQKYFVRISNEEYKCPNSSGQGDKWSRCKNVEGLRLECLESKGAHLTWDKMELEIVCVEPSENVFEPANGAIPKSNILSPDGSNSVRVQDILPGRCVTDAPTSSPSRSPSTSQPTNLPTTAEPTTKSPTASPVTPAPTTTASVLDVCGTLVSRNSSSALLYGLQCETLPETIAELRYLRSLSLFSPAVRTIPTTLGLMTKLTSLFLYIGAATLPAEIAKLTQLQEIDISIDQLASFPAEILPLTSLNRLVISHSPVQALPSNIGRLTNLEYLKATNLSLISLPPSLTSLEKLTNVDLSWNPLKSSAVSRIWNITSLEDLKLWHIGMRSLPPGISDLAHLKSLDLSYNPIGSIPLEVFDIKFLSRLSARKMELTVIPKEIEKISRLRDLDLAGNLLTDIPGQLTGLNLYSLNIESNQFRKLNPVVGQIDGLTMLDLDDNKLTELPQTLFNLTQLWDLHVRNHKVESLPPEFGKLVGLRKIDMSGGKLRFLPSEISKLTRLADLSVERNAMTVLTKEIGNLPLTSLRIGQNSFEEPLPHELGKLTRLNVLSIGEVECDCHFLSWFPGLVEKARGLSTFASCSTDSLYGDIYPRLLRAESKAPCSIAKAVAFEGGARTGNLSFRYSSGVEVSANLDSSAVQSLVGIAPDLTRWLERRERDSVLLNCEYLVFHYDSSLDSRKKILGFEINVKAVKEDGVAQRRCIYAENLLFDDSDLSMFVYEIHGLIPATDYDVTVAPFFAHFTPGIFYSISNTVGVRTKTYRFTTSPSVPERPPTNLTLLSARAREITLAYSPPHEAYTHGKIETYRIRMSSVGPSPAAVLKTSDTTRVTFAASEFPNFKPSATYTFQVQAKTRAPGYGPWSDVVNITSCPENSRAAGSSECKAEVGYFHDSVLDTFVSCDNFRETLPAGALVDGNCFETGLSSKDIQISHGYWKPHIDSLVIKRCPRRAYCKPSENSSLNDPYCTQHHIGPYCYACVPGHAVIGETCQPCTTETDSLTVISVTSLVSILLLVASFILVAMFKIGVFNGCISGVKGCVKGLVSCCGMCDCFGCGSDSDGDGCSRSSCISFVWAFFKNLANSVIDSPKFTILLGFFQVLAAYQRTFLPMQRRSAVALLLNALVVLNLEDVLVFFVASVRCSESIPFNHYTQLVSVIVWVVSFFTLLTCVCFLLSRCFEDEEDRNAVLAFGFSFGLFVLANIFTPVSQTLFGTLFCEEIAIPNQQSILALKADYKVDCAAEDRSSFKILAYVFIGLFVCGVPLLYMCSLIKHRHLIHESPDSLTTKKKHTLSSIRILIFPYKAERSWFEIFELVRKLTQTVLIDFLHDPNVVLNDRNLQSVSVFLCFGFAIATALLSPYNRLADLAFSTLSLFLLACAAYPPWIEGMHGNTSNVAEICSYVELGLFVVVVLLESIYRSIKGDTETRAYSQYTTD